MARKSARRVARLPETKSSATARSTGSQSSSASVSRATKSSSPSRTNAGLGTRTTAPAMEWTTSSASQTRARSPRTVAPHASRRATYNPCSSWRSHLCARGSKTASSSCSLCRENVTPSGYVLVITSSDNGRTPSRASSGRTEPAKALKAEAKPSGVVDGASKTTPLERMASRRAARNAPCSSGRTPSIDRSTLTGLRSGATTATRAAASSCSKSVSRSAESSSRASVGPSSWTAAKPSAVGQTRFPRSRIGTKSAICADSRPVRIANETTPRTPRTSSRRVGNVAADSAKAVAMATWSFSDAPVAMSACGRPNEMPASWHLGQFAAPLEPRPSP
mmetsp:Transcript_21424/g.65827  ORF Transcript_21424/g.65827 Transcript_21424/m.65827 type:complete len:335 (-) Transcript_21424:794-1798(-)